MAGDGGAKLLARQWSVPEEKIRTWVSHYRLHGIDGLRPKRSTYSAQFKLQVLSHQDREQQAWPAVRSITSAAQPCERTHSAPWSPWIRAVYDEHKGRYGYRRIKAALCNSMEKPVNHKCVQRLMQKMGLRALIGAKKRSRPVPGINDAHVPNLLERDFCAAAPNQKWVTDVTEFNVNGHKLYLSAFMDLYNGEIVAHQMARRPVFELVSSTLESALARTACTGELIVHSDQGWHTRCSPIDRCLRCVESSKA